MVSGVTITFYVIYVVRCYLNDVYIVGCHGNVTIVVIPTYDGGLLLCELFHLNNLTWKIKESIV